MDNLIRSVMPVLQSIHQTRGDSVHVVAVPFTDGKRGLNILIDLAKAVKSEGKDLNTYFEKAITLSLIDEAWKHHLRAVDDLKQEVQLASYEQKDPIVIYKKEAFNLFSAMIGSVNRDIASFLFKGQVPQADPEHVRNAEQEKQKAFARKIQEGRGELAESSNSANNQQPQQEVENKLEPIRVGEKVGRNDPCPCGSGKKFKSCHGKEA
ncbi:MAG: SEC-C metal-binding domain-containing protein [Chitinophagales bacterium]